MAEKEWADVLEKKLLKIVKENFDMDNDELTEAIKDNVDINDLIGEIFEEDEEFKNKVKEKIKKLFLKKLEDCDSLEEVDDDSDNLYEYLPEDMTAKEIISGALEEEGEEEDDDFFRKKVVEKVQALFLKEVDNCEDLEGLIGEEVSLSDYLPDDFVSNNLTEMFSGGEARGNLIEKLKSLLEGELDNFDSDDLPERDELMKLLNINEAIKKVSQGDEIKAKIMEAFRKITEEWIDENLDADDLPDDFKEKLIAIAPINQLLSDRDFHKQIIDGLINAFKQLTIDQLKDVDSELNRKLLASGALSVIVRQMENLMRDSEVQHMVEKNLQEQLCSDGKLTKMLVETLLRELSKTMIGKLFENKR